MVTNIWHIMLPNGNIVIYCIWSEDGIDLLISLMERNSKAFSIDEKATIRVTSYFCR